MALFKCFSPALKQEPKSGRCSGKQNTNHFVPTKSGQNKETKRESEKSAEFWVSEHGPYECCAVRRREKNQKDAEVRGGQGRFQVRPILLIFLPSGLRPWGERERKHTNSGADERRSFHTVLILCHQFLLSHSRLPQRLSNACLTWHGTLVPLKNKNDTVRN